MYLLGKFQFPVKTAMVVDYVLVIKEAIVLRPSIRCAVEWAGRAFGLAVCRQWATRWDRCQ
ncbi:hypothetical protein ADT25_04005 [Xanthomonas oryzae]|uniref:Uncharacterized protein n=1 Tax=Xanthomonas oryzae TaxID=347 RepID=A0AAP0ZP99_9XANT|nr:hypothetical protein [Xanthomonas oryzae]KOR47938.1 hypothetical protein ADT25_04005 [Xanthomonas oryzae]QBG83165.1 hypothetical protein EYR27_03345 [Xanthomonas oryzae]